MPLYEYQCRECGRDKYTTTRQIPSPCSCGGVYRRVFSFSYHAPMPEHWNHAVNRPISSMAQFRSELARQSDEATQRTGIPHDFQPVDIHDKQSLGVTDEGMDSTLRQQTNSGAREAKLWL